MAWLTPFKLGRPAREALFEINPSALTWDDRKLVDARRALNGGLTAVTLSRSRPVIQINGNYITPDFWNQLRALQMVDDTFLVFEPMDGAGTPANVWESWTERVVPSSLTTIVIPDNSALRGSALRVAAGGASGVSLIGLWNDLASTAGRIGSGPNWLLTAGADAFGTGFEPATYTVGNLDTQDSWSASPAANCNVTNTGGEVITGTQSVRFRLAGSTATRVFAAQAQPYSTKFQLELAATLNGTEVDALTRTGVSGGINWGIRIVRTAGVVRLQLLVAPATVVYDQPLTQVAPYAFQVIVDQGTYHVLYNGAFIASVATVNTGCDRCTFAGSGGAEPGTFGLLDEVHVQPLSSVGTTYNDATRTITLGTPLLDLSPRFLTLRCPLVAVHIKGLPANTEGGWVDIWRYTVELEGA